MFNSVQTHRSAMIVHALAYGLLCFGINIAASERENLITGHLKIRVHDRHQKQAVAQDNSDGYASAPSLALPQQKVHIVTAVGPRPCKTVMGSYLGILALKNFENFAASRPDEFTFRWHMGMMDVDLAGMWNKIAILRHMFHQMPENPNEWLMWVDLDALILDTDFRIPFEQYQGKDLVIWRGTNTCKTDKRMSAINAGVLLFRNTKWSRYFLSELTELSKPAWRPGGDNFHLLESMFEDYRQEFYEQAAISYLWLTRPDLAEKSECGQQWRDGLQYGEIHTGLPEWRPQDLQHEDAYPFIVHWAGCQFCLPEWGEYTKEECVTAFLDVYAVASKRLHKTLQTDLPWGEWGLNSTQVTHEYWVNVTRKTARKLIELDLPVFPATPVQL